jgi:hypothetical protein
MNITRAVVLDLWPAYAADEASADTRALVDEFLRQDPDFARQLREDVLTGVPAPPIPPDTEVKALSRARRRLGGYRSLLLLALVFTCQAFARIVSDTSWDVSPRRFIATAAVAAAFWIAFLVSLWRMRARILIVPERGPRAAGGSDGARHQ